MRCKDSRFNSPPADVVTWPWGFGCRRVSVSQLKRWHRLCDSAWGPSAFARRFTGCPGTAEARLARDRFTYASLKWIRCGRERTLKSRLKCCQQILKTEAFIWACLFWSIVQTQPNNILAPLKVSLCQYYINIFAKWTREATPRRVCVANFATFTEKCDWFDDTTLKLKPRLVVFSFKLFMTSFHSEETC